VAEFLELGQKQAALVLAETLDYDVAAERLKIAPSDLRAKIAGLEEKLCLCIFKEDAGGLSLTDDGRRLIRVFQDALGRDNRG
jgi:DNA-binding transcriptional LysR family regulator